MIGILKMYKEIGSEFWQEKRKNINNDSFIKSTEKEVFLLSGRTALDYIIRDAKKTYGLKTIWLPSYCCHSMISPFIKNGVGIKFYPVYFNGANLIFEMEKISSDEALYIMQYFGFMREYPEIVRDISKQVNLVIEDRTHVAFCKNNDTNSLDFIDYSYSSFRKWTFLPGLALAKKENGEFSLMPPTKINNKYVNIRINSAHQKYEYMHKNIGEKEVFLEGFSLAEDILDKDYYNYASDEESINIFNQLDLKAIKKARRSNALVLLKGLHNSQIMTPIFSTLRENDIPLFIPMVVDVRYRNKLRNYLAQNAVYCPIHWPLSNLHYELSDEQKKLYNEELSLICDQRYTGQDIKKIIHLIQKFEENLIK